MNPKEYSILKEGWIRKLEGKYPVKVEVALGELKPNKFSQVFKHFGYMPHHPRQGISTWYFTNQAGLIFFRNWAHKQPRRITEVKDGQ